MKKFCLFFFLITFFALFASFIAEMTNLIPLQERNISIEFERNGADLILKWTPLPYPCTYKIETFSETTGILKESPRYHFLTAAETSEPIYKVPRTPIPNFYVISARGIFGEEIFRTKIIANPNFPTPPRPIPIFHYTKKNPASLMPFLVWHVVPNAVCYEMEFLSAPPEIEGGISPSEKYHIASTTKIFTNGYQADLREMFYKYKKIYWRVRALGLHHEPIGEFSNSELICVDETLTPPNCPLINDFDFINYKNLPLYQAYNWIPINNAVQYEVEVLNHPPTVENDTEPSADSLWRQKTRDQSSIYDEYSRPFAGPYYWRVRALDAENNPIGTWSNSEKFVVEDFTGGVNTAILGDSVAHGGGAVSYSPRALEYAYSTYFDFPTLNISRSGDTSKTSLQRVYSDVLPFHPKNLIISTGINCLRDARISAESVIEDLTEIKNICLENDIRPIFLTLMPVNPENIFYVFRTETDENWHEKLVAINNFIRQQEFYIDIEPYFYDAAGNMSATFSIDGLHPDLRGKMLIGEIVNLNRHLFRN